MRLLFSLRVISCLGLCLFHHGTVKPVLSSHSKRRPKIGSQTDYRLMQVKITPRSILQYFRPSFSNHLSLRSLFCLFLSGRLRQVLLYVLLVCFDALRLSTNQLIKCLVEGHNTVKPPAVSLKLATLQSPV